MGGSVGPHPASAAYTLGVVQVANLRGKLGHHGPIRGPWALRLSNGLAGMGKGGAVSMRW